MPCRRLRRTIDCMVTEYGIPDDLDRFTSSHFDLDYPMRAKRVDGHWRVWSPEIDFN